MYLRETQHQQHWADTTALVTHNKQDRYRGTGVPGYRGTGVQQEVHVDCYYRQLTTEERLLKWGAANNVKIKVSSVTLSQQPDLVTSSAARVRDLLHPAPDAGHLPAARLLEDRPQDHAHGRHQGGGENICAII